MRSWEFGSLVCLAVAVSVEILASSRLDTGAAWDSD